MSADKYPSIFSHKIENIVYVDYYVAIYLDGALLFCPSLFPIWTHNFPVYIIILLISIDLPSPPQLPRTCALTLVSGLTDARCAPVDLQTAPR